MTTSFDREGYDHEMDLIRADLALIKMDQQSRQDNKDPVLVEVTKAVVLATEFSDIEARVVCKTGDQAVTAYAMLSALAPKYLARFDDKKCELVFPNSSAVVVTLEIAAALDVLAESLGTKVG